MSIGPMGGIAGSVAGSPLAQIKGSDTERAQQDSVAQQRRVDSDSKAEAASGIGETDGDDHETAERDADGRSSWEAKAKAEEDPLKLGEESCSEEPQSKDASGQSGNLLDLSG